MTQLETGQVFAGRYRVVRMLTTGGMGAVFEAEHTATEARVALKLLLPHIIAVQSARAKFELEARVAARVRSEHIVQVLDAGFDEETQSPFLVMELLEGHTLAAEIARRRELDPGRAVAVLRQVARGLDAAHTFNDGSGVVKPIIHRDLKPDNLFLTQRPDGSLLVKILDFGIAKVLNETRNLSQEVRGTPTYMAYEQVTAGVLSAQTDVWALGLIAYHALTGKQYWRTADDPDAGIHSLFAEILTLPIEPASARMRQQKLAARLPPAFDGWFARCVDRDPQRRFATAGKAIEELGRALGAQAASALPYASTVPEHPGDRALADFGVAHPGSATAKSLPALSHEPIPMRKHSRLVLFSAVAVLGVMASAGTTIWLFGQDRAVVASEPVATAASAAAAAQAPETVRSVAPAPEPKGVASPTIAAEELPAPKVKVEKVDAPAPDLSSMDDDTFVKEAVAPQEARAATPAKRRTEAPPQRDARRATRAEQLSDVEEAKPRQQVDRKPAAKPPASKPASAFDEL